MTVSVGVKLGPYEILALLGAGGMGEVYKARDTRLNRTVAIKVLPPQSIENAEARQRFEREARAVSSLNHPHIRSLYDVGRQDDIDYLVMEYLDGETLNTRLAGGALPVEQALRYAREIAEALTDAHRQGVCHRDLKPGNIMLTKSGAKLLDFGLAKLRESGQQTSDLTSMPTKTRDLTQKGAILGTLQYMAPEQLEGMQTDARSDIFSFGAVLYEMVTGRKAFEGKSQASVIAAILDREPPQISSLRPGLPAPLDRVVKTCLVKNPEERWQSAADLARELQWIAEGSSPAAVRAVETATHLGPTYRRLLPWVLATIFLLSTIVLGALHYRRTPEPAQIVRFPISFPGTPVLRPSDYPVISPDGRLVVFASLDEQHRRVLWVRPLDSMTLRALPGTDGATLPFWSPDSRSLAFFAQGSLKRIDLSTGLTLTICDYDFGAGGAWSRTGVLIISKLFSGPLYQVSAAGGKAQPLTELDSSRHEIAHQRPEFLPDGRHFLYWSVTPEPDAGGVFVASVDSPKNVRRLIAGNSKALYVPGSSGPGYLLFSRGETLMAQVFDSRSLRLSGEPFQVTGKVAELGTVIGGGAFSASDNGVLAYRAGTGQDVTQLSWFDRTGRRLDTVGEPGVYTNPALSPDGRKVAVSRWDERTRSRDLWLFDLTHGNSSRFTFDPADDTNPVWSPDGARVAFTSDRKGQRNIYQRLASGTGEDEPLLESPERKSVTNWSRDGRFLVYDLAEDDIWALPLFGDRKPIRIVAAPQSQVEGQFSPNGRWIAYTSDEAGRPEVYVQSFGASAEGKTAGKWRISTSGGREPAWRADGKELFFVSQKRLVAVAVKPDGASFEFATPKLLFEAPMPNETRRNRYVVSADGQRFLINATIETGDTPPFTVVVNWMAGLRR